MAITAKVVNGALDKPLPWENGTMVTVSPAQVNDTTPAQGEKAKEVNTRNPLLDFAGIIDDPTLPTDLSVNFDHYLYGHPKK